MDLFSDWTRKRVKTQFIKKWKSRFTFIWMQYHCELSWLAEHPLHLHLVFCEVTKFWPWPLGHYRGVPELLWNSRCKGSSSCLQGARRHVFGVQDWVKLFILQASKVAIKTGSGSSSCFCFKFFFNREMKVIQLY